MGFFERNNPRTKWKIWGVGLFLAVFFAVFGRYLWMENYGVVLQLPLVGQSETSEKDASTASSKATFSGVDERHKTPPVTNNTNSQSVKILFGGDLMFDRYIRQVAIKRGNDFVFAPELKARMVAVDAVVANLEGPITQNASKSVGSVIGSPANYIFSFDPSWARTLRENNISIVNIGNNHILNFGKSGLAETRTALDASQVGFFGDPEDEHFRILTRTLQGVRIGFVNENQFVIEGESRALADVRVLRPQVDVLVAYTHWGKEYSSVTDDERRRAHALIDAGVDVVIGSHPHVVQEKEWYNGKIIYYSLGNFVFDQYEQPETEQGLLVEMDIDSSTKQLSFSDIPLVLHTNGQTSL